MKLPFRLLTRVSILLGSIAATTQAATLGWDPDGILVGATGGNGNWTQVGGFWNLNGVFVPWSNATNAADTAFFGGTAGTVTLTEAISAGGIGFDVAGYTLTGGVNPLTLANNAVIGTNFITTGTATINTTIGGTNLIFNPVAVDSLSPNLSQGRIVLGANLTNTGTTTISGGMLDLNTGVTMNTGTGIIVNGSGLYHPSAQTGTDYPFHRLHQGMLRFSTVGDVFGSQMVTLNGGTLLWNSPAGGSDVATVQNLTLGSGNNTLAAGPNGGAPNGDTLAITNLTRNANATVEFRSQYGTLGANADNGKIAITNLNGVAVTNTNGILGGWAYANETEAALQGNGFATAFARWDSTVSSVVAATPDKTSGTAGATLINQSLAAATSVDNWLANGNNANNTISTNVTINTLIEQSDVIVNSGATLTIGSGGVIFRNANFWLQSADATGKITSGDASGNLYLNVANTVDGLIDFRLRVKVTDSTIPVRLVKSGNGSVQVGQFNSGASTVNTYTGGTIIQMGRLQAGAVDAFGTGTVTVQPGGQALLSIAGTYANAFDLSGSGAQENAGVLGAVRFASGAVISGNVNLSGTTRLTETVAGETGTISGLISGGFGFEKTGAGALLLSGASANTYTGDTLVSAGTLRAGKAQPFGPAANGVVFVRAGAALDTNNFDLGTKILDIQGTGIGGTGAMINSAAGTAVGTLRLQLSADATIGGTGRWDVRGAGSTVTLNNFTLTKTGANLISLVGASVGPGKIVVNQGNLGLEAGTSVPSAANSSIQINTGGSLWVHDFGTAVTLTRDLILNGGELTSNATGGNGNSVIGSAISIPVASNINVVADTMRLTGPISGAGALSKIGAGVLRVDGAITGVPALNVNGGKLTLGAASGLPAGITTTVASGAQLETLAANLAVPSTSTLIVGRTGAAATDVLGSVTFGAGSTLNVGGTASARTATFANNLTLSGTTVRMDLGSAITPGNGISDLVSVAGTLDLTGGNITVAINQLGALASGSYTLFTAGTLIGSAANFNAQPGVPNSRQTLAFDTTSVPNSVLLTASGSKSLTWVGGVAGNVWDLNTTLNWNDGAIPEKFFNLDSVTFLETGSGTVPLAGTLLPASATVNATANYTFTGSGILSGSGVLNKQGTGTLVIANTGANDFSGTTTVSGGVLQIGDGTNGKLGSGPVVNNASVVLQLADGSTFANVVSGTGNLTKAGTSTVSLTGASTHTGATIVTGGTLIVASMPNGGTASPLGAGANTADKVVLNGGTLRYTGAAVTSDRLFSLGTAGATLDASGTGALTLSNTGTLGIVGTGARTFTLTGTSTASNQLNSGIPNDGANATALVKTGAGTWVLNGANSFTGGVTVNGGVLAADGSQVNNRVTAANLVTVNNTGTFEVRGVNAIGTVNVNVNQGGTLRLVTGGSAVTGAAGTSHAHLGNVTLSGGTMDLAYFGTGAAYDGESFQLDGSLVVTGTTPSAVNTTQAITLQGIGLNGVRTFTVNDVTASPAVDFSVNAELENRDGGILGGVLKDGAGTMQLTKQNTLTGGITVAAGTLLVDSNIGLILPNNASVTAQAAGTFDLRGVNALPTGANAIDVTVGVGGTFRVQSGGSTFLGAAGASHNHIRNVNLNGGAVDLFYSGGGTAYNNESFQLNGNVTVGGTAMSTINFSGGATLATQGVALNGNRTFTVADATAGTDLKVFAELENSDTTPADDGVVKAGPGTMEIAGESTYSGPTIVNGGAFLVSGKLTGTGSVTVASSAVFGGSGTVTPTGAMNLSAGAIFQPGTNGIGTLTVDGSSTTAVDILAFLPDAVLNFELSGASSDSVALINGATNDIYFGGNLLTLSGPAGAGPYTLFSSNVPNAYEGLVVDGSGKILAGLILDPAFTSLNPNASLKLVGNDIQLAVPEPASALMLLGGLGMLAARRTRKKLQA